MLDYREMWDKLWVELSILNEKGVKAIHPELVRGYMRFIEQAQIDREELPEHDPTPRSPE